MTVHTDPHTTSAPRSLNLPTGRTLVGAVFAICVLGAVAAFGLQILFTDIDPHKSEGPLESMVGIGLFGSVALAVTAALVAWLGREPSSARVGAFVLAALAVVALPFFWCGAPGILGAGAAWMGGLTRGSQPQAGAARVAGLVGLLLATLNVGFNAVSFVIALV